jgi:hypothetical protein
MIRPEQIWLVVEPTDMRRALTACHNKFSKHWGDHLATVRRTPFAIGAAIGSNCWSGTAPVSGYVFGVCIKVASPGRKVMMPLVP